MNHPEFEEPYLWSLEELQPLYFLERDLLAQEVGLQSDLDLLEQLLDLIQYRLGDQVYQLEFDQLVLLVQKELQVLAQAQTLAEDLVRQLESQVEQLDLGDELGEAQE